jgi:hypothetical protein
MRCSRLLYFRMALKFYESVSFILVIGLVIGDGCLHD